MRAWDAQLGVVMGEKGGGCESGCEEQGHLPYLHAQANEEHERKQYPCRAVGGAVSQGELNEENTKWTGRVCGGFCWVPILSSRRLTGRVSEEEEKWETGVANLMSSAVWGLESGGL